MPSTDYRMLDQILDPGTSKEAREAAEFFVEHAPDGLTRLSHGLLNDPEGISREIHQFAFEFIGPRSGKKRRVAFEHQIPKSVREAGQFQAIKPKRGIIKTSKTPDADAVRVKGTVGHLKALLESGPKAIQEGGPDPFKKIARVVGTLPAKEVRAIAKGLGLTVAKGSRKKDIVTAINEKFEAAMKEAGVARRAAQPAKKAQGLGSRVMKKFQQAERKRESSLDEMDATKERAERKREIGTVMNIIKKDVVNGFIPADAALKAQEIFKDNPSLPMTKVAYDRDADIFDAIAEGHKLGKVSDKDFRIILDSRIKTMDALQDLRRLHGNIGDIITQTPNAFRPERLNDFFIIDDWKKAHALKKKRLAFEYTTSRGSRRRVPEYSDLPQRVQKDPASANVKETTTKRKIKGTTGCPRRRRVQRARRPRTPTHRSRPP